MLLKQRRAKEEKRHGFLGVLEGILGARLLGNISAEKGQEKKRVTSSFN